MIFENEGINSNHPFIFSSKYDKDIINFSSNQPDLPPPQEVYSILPNYENFKYGLTSGQMELRNELAKHYPNSDAQNFIITNGATEALDLTLRTIGFKQPNSKLLLLRPYYPTYPINAKYNNLGCVYSDLIEGKINFEDIDNKIRGCSAIIINSPNNPTGSVESIKTLKMIEKLTKDLGIYILCDEVYKDIIYDRQNYILKGENIVTINNFSRTYAMDGFRTGYIWSQNKDLLNEILKIKSISSLNTNMLGQYMALEALKVSKKFVEGQLMVWKERRRIILNGFSELGLAMPKAEGAFYVFPSIKNSIKSSEILFKKYKIATYPGEYFGVHNKLRISYACDISKIEEGIKRIGKFVSVYG